MWMRSSHNHSNHSHSHNSNRNHNNHNHSHINSSNRSSCMQEQKDSYKEIDPRQTVNIALATIMSTIMSTSMAMTMVVFTSMAMVVAMAVIVAVIVAVSKVTEVTMAMAVAVAATLRLRLRRRCQWWRGYCSFQGGEMLAGAVSGTGTGAVFRITPVDCLHPDPHLPLPSLRNSSCR